MAAFVCVVSLVCSCAFAHVQIFTRIPNTYCFPRFHAYLAKQAFVHAALGRRDLEIRARPQCRQEGLKDIRYTGLWVGWFFFQSLGGWSRLHVGGGDGGRVRKQLALPLYEKYMLSLPSSSSHLTPQTGKQLA
jgi:hypothetical protein